ncbi:MAG: DUF1385 domain-containing protein [Clostridia bacterium]|nr:DUF1385 domain-containing protein [Clostridia bacterium]
MKKEEKKQVHKTSIGGQAVIEGVMMRGPEKIATSVRKSSGEILLKVDDIGQVRRKKILKLPVIRGVVNFIDSMVLGVRTLMYSADQYDVEEDEEAYKPSKFDDFIERVFSKDALIYVSVVIALIFSVGLFILLPAAITSFLRPFVQSDLLKTLVEGLVRMTIFILYIFLVSRMKDIQRVFEYHGAEHKTIACYEHGEELTVENVKKYSRFHPRCGTSFLIMVMIISVLVFSVVSWNNILVRMGIKILLLPVVAGITYEFIKLAGRSENKIVQILNKPGLWLQRLTTREPDASQIEVAISSLNAVCTGNREDDKW